MFDFSKLGDMTKLANEAKQLQVKQEEFQQEQIALLRDIKKQLAEVIMLLKNR